MSQFESEWWRIKMSLEKVIKGLLVLTALATQVKGQDFYSLDALDHEAHGFVDMNNDMVLTFEDMYFMKVNNVLYFHKIMKIGGGGVLPHPKTEMVWIDYDGDGRYDVMYQVEVENPYLTGNYPRSPVQKKNKKVLI